MPNNGQKRIASIRINKNYRSEATTDFSKLHSPHSTLKSAVKKQTNAINKALFFKGYTLVY
jgi:hypothetical protein